MYVHVFSVSLHTYWHFLLKQLDQSFILFTAIMHKKVPVDSTVYFDPSSSCRVWGKGLDKCVLRGRG